MLPRGGLLKKPDPEKQAPSLTQNKKQKENEKTNTRTAAPSCCHRRRRSLANTAATGEKAAGSYGTDRHEPIPAAVQQAAADGSSAIKHETFSQMTTGRRREREPLAGSSPHPADIRFAACLVWCLDAIDCYPTALAAVGGVVAGGDSHL